MHALIRSKLFVPGSRPELFAKAAASAADALSLDLEDAVAEDRKVQARTEVAAFLRDLPRDLRAWIIVRVNGMATGLFEDDLAAIVGPGLQWINLPRVESAGQVREAAALLARLEARAGLAVPIGILANIETPKGLRMAAEIAAADTRVTGLQIGYADLFEPCGIDRSYPAALDAVRVAVRLAAAEAGVQAYDGAYAGVAQPQVFNDECVAAQRLGFAGKSCIHPSQVAIANAAFAPSAAQIERARRVVAAGVQAQAQGVGAYLVEGQMIDKPFLRSAQAVVALADRLGLDGQGN